MPSTVDAGDDQAAQARVESESLKFRLGIERSGDAVFMTSSDGTITYVNPAFEKIYGYTSAEAIGRTPRLLKSGAQAPEFYERLWARLRDKEVVPIEVINRAKDGRMVHVEATANPILDDRGDIIGFLAIERDITERKRVEQRLHQSEEALRESETQYRGLFDHSPIPTWVFDLETMRFLKVSETMLRHYGYSREELLRMTVTDLLAPQDAATPRAHIPGARRCSLRKHKKKDGSVIDVEVTEQVLEAGERRCQIVYAQDVTDRMRLEQQLLQAQKMEAVGQLAGGIAHDFNNLLSVILSYASLAIESLTRGDPLREDMVEIQKAGRRATDLTGRLLAFSRRQVLQPRVIDLNESVANMHRMLGRLLGEDVELKTVAAPSLWTVKVDPGQIEQVVMNLAVNARDAMPKGGVLTLETGNVDLDEAYACNHSGTTPGSHVMLAVSDTGVGMDAATRARIFEPFFTTKEIGKGTGLGLSTVFGIVQQSGGSIWVYSEPGIGTTFKIYFPRAEATAERGSTRPPSAALRHRSETVLLTEDEEQLRYLVRAVLERKGYEVLVAASPAAALLLSEQHPGEIDLLLTDVVMPGMDGRQLADRLTRSRPGLRVLFMSGYTGSVVVDRGVLDEGVAFLQKPITPEAVLMKVREVLDAR